MDINGMEWNILTFMIIYLLFYSEYGSKIRKCFFNKNVVDFWMEIAQFTINSLNILYLDFREWMKKTRKRGTEGCKPRDFRIGYHMPLSS